LLPCDECSRTGDPNPLAASSCIPLRWLAPAPLCGTPRGVPRSSLGTTAGFLLAPNFCTPSWVSLSCLHGDTILALANSPRAPPVGMYRVTATIMHNGHMRSYPGRAVLRSPRNHALSHINVLFFVSARTNKRHHHHLTSLRPPHPITPAHTCPGAVTHCGTWDVWVGWWVGGDGCGTPPARGVAQYHPRARHGKGVPGVR
jgi:hypothetical protein